MKKILLTIFLSFIPYTLLAANYQAQGCGLGSTIWTDGSDLSHQVLGALTNSTAGNTFGMTSGTLNCELESLGYAQVVFIKANRVALANDIARGKGETLASLSRMYGCESIESAGPLLQKNYEKIFKQEKSSAQEINRSISSYLQNDQSCI